MNRLLLLVATFFLFSVKAFAADEIECSGQIIDDLGEPIIGATISVDGSTIATATDVDGKFKIKVPKKAKSLKVSYVGYKNLILNPTANVGVLKMEIESTMLQDVVVTQSIAKTRKTPVAISQIDQATIDVKLGNQEFPEVLKSTPGVWTTKDGGGFGDAKTNMRGFKSPNVAVLINGIPVNDMEWGGV